MTELLDLLHKLGVWSVPALWIPLLAWTLLALPAALLLRRTSRFHPLVRYRLQQALLAALPLGMLAAPWIEMPGLAGWLMASSGTSASPGLVLLPDLLTTADPASDSATPISLYLYHGLGALTAGAGLWALVRLTRLARSTWALIRLDATTPATSAPDVQALTDQLADTLSIRRPVTTRTTSEAVVPMTFGMLRPTILLPAALADRREALRMTLVHELVHIRRYDVVARWMEQFTAAVFAIHPGVSSLARSIECTREIACDAEALRQSGCTRTAYADLLYGFARSSAHRPVFAVSITETASALKERIQAMTDFDRMTSRLSRFTPLIVIATFLAVALGVVACSDAVTPSNEESDESAATATTQQKQDDEVFVTVEDHPELKGGMQALIDEVQYPEAAKEEGIEGRVFVQFVVNESGGVQDVEITRGIHELLDEEAVRAVKQVEFEPGEQQGEPVKVQMSLPITFKLPGE